MSVELPLRERQKKRRGRAILAAAMVEFGERGFEGARIEDIARRAEVAPATVYNYFTDKSGILLALFRDRLERQTSRLVEAANARSDDILAALDHFLDTTLDIDYPRGLSDLFRRAYAASYARDGSRLAAFVAEDDRLVHGALARLFRRHQSRGAIPPSVRPEDLADIVFAIGTLHWMRWVVGEVPELGDVKQDMKRQCRIAVAGVCRLDEK